MLRKGLFIDHSFLGQDVRQVCIERTHGHFSDRFSEGYTLRPGLKDTVNLYCVTYLKEGLLIAFGSKLQTRYYLIQPKRLKRYSIIVDVPSFDFESVWDNLFVGLCSDDSRKALYMYTELSDLFQEHFVIGGVKRSFEVEGQYKGKDFVASITFTPEQPGRLSTTSTMDLLPGRDIPFHFHPLEALHRACSK